MGLWSLDFPPPAGGGGGIEHLHPRLSRLLRIVDQTENGIRKLVKNNSETNSVIFKLRLKLRSPEVKRSNLTKMGFRQ